MLENLIFSLTVTTPIFIVLCLGILLKRAGIINNEFARIGSDLSFKVALPCLLFVKLVNVSFENPPLSLLIYAVLSLVIIFLLLDRVIAPRLAPEDRGAFVQGAFRSNMGIVGLAYCLSAFGEGILPTAAIYLAVMTTMYNVLSVITLNRHLLLAEAPSPFRAVLKGVVTNPLILTIMAALLVSYFSLPIPAIALETMGYLAAMALPLALLCGGAAIRWREFHTSKNLYRTTAAKLVFVPGLVVLGGLAIGFRGETLGLLFFMSAAPTATASYPMVRAMGGNHFLAAAVIATSSLGSMVAITLGLFLLRSLGWV